MSAPISARRRSGVRVRGDSQRDQRRRAAVAEGRCREGGGGHRPLLEARRLRRRRRLDGCRRRSRESVLPARHRRQPYVGSATDAHDRGDAGPRRCRARGVDNRQDRGSDRGGHGRQAVWRHGDRHHQAANAGSPPSPTSRSASTCPKRRTRSSRPHRATPCWRRIDLLATSTAYLKPREAQERMRRIKYELMKATNEDANGPLGD